MYVTTSHTCVVHHTQARYTAYALRVTLPSCAIHVSTYTTTMMCNATILYNLVKL